MDEFVSVFLRWENLLLSLSELPKLINFSFLQISKVYFTLSKMVLKTPI